MIAKIEEGFMFNTREMPIEGKMTPLVIGSGGPGFINLR